MRYPPPENRSIQWMTYKILKMHTGLNRRTIKPSQPISFLPMVTMRQTAVVQKYWDLLTAVPPWLFLKRPFKVFREDWANPLSRFWSQRYSFMNLVTSWDLSTTAHPCRQPIRTWLMENI